MRQPVINTLLCDMFSELFPNSIPSYGSRLMKLFITI